MNLVDTLFQRLVYDYDWPINGDLFYDYDWPINGDQVYEELSQLDFEGTGQVQHELMAMF